MRFGGVLASVFGAIRLEFVQFDPLAIEGRHQFPIPVANRQIRPEVGGLLVAVVPPENGPGAMEGFALESRKHIFAIAIAIGVGRRRNSGGGAEGGEQIHRRQNRGVIFQAGRSMARPPHDERHAHAAFKETGFSSPQAAGFTDAVIAAIGAGNAFVVFPGLRWAVIAGKNDQGVLRDSAPLQRIEDHPDFVVAVGDDRRVNLLPGVEMFPFLHGFVRRAVGQMALMQPHVHVERSVFVRLDELHRLVGNIVPRGSDIRPRPVIDRRLVNAVVRHGWFPHAQMPFAKVPRAIARCFEHAWCRGCLRVQPVRHLRRFSDTEDRIDSEATRITPRHGRGTTGRADRTEHIELLEINALTGEFVEARSFQPRVAVTG